MVGPRDRAKPASRQASRRAPHDAREARRLDLNAEDLGVPMERLMGNAGKALAEEATRQLRRAGGRGRAAGVLLLCGKGNNGGDGFAAAAELQSRGIAARVVLAEPPARIASAAARAHFARLAKGSWAVWRRPRAEWREAIVLADCLLGSGLSGAPRGTYAAMARWINERKRAGRTVVSCDVPSGVGTSVAVRPTVTLALHAPQDVLAKGNAGRVRVARIGIPAQARHIGFGDLVHGYPEVGEESHKGQNGVVLVVGGSLPLAGASHYVALGACRTGADLVHIATAHDAASWVRAWGPESIVHPLPAGDHLLPAALPAIGRLMERVGAVVVGPGLGQHPSTLALARRVLAAAADRGLPVVVDADGLDAVEADLLGRHGGKMVLTPHGREFLDLAGKAATRANVSSYARRHGVTVLRKGAIDVVSDGRTTRECHRGHPTMTVGGTGDVLAGIVAALLAKGAPTLDAACAASYLSKAAGEVAATVRSYGATATDVAEAIPAVLVRLEARRQAKA